MQPQHIAIELDRKMNVLGTLVAFPVGMAPLFLRGKLLLEMRNLKRET